MLCLSVPLLAQRTITNKDFRGRITEQYQINANGDYHGTYTKYFSNGVIQELATYNKGKITSCKTYEYIGKKRYLMSDKTWDRNGEILTSKIRPYNYSNGEVGEVIETAGLLRNGRWRGWPGHETYIEIYNGNDTIYEWQDRSKSKFRGKFLNGERVKTTKEIHLLNEIATRDSIKHEKGNEYDFNYSNDRHFRDSIKSISNDYYGAFMYHFEDNEVQFYEFMYTYLQTGQDATLKALIIDALDLQYITNISDLQFSIDSGSNNSYARLKILVGNTLFNILSSCNYHSGTLRNDNIWRNSHEIPDTQAKLLKVIEYATEIIPE